MGVTYKLKNEVVQFIISQRQGDPFISCRQLAESASLQFGLRLSKSSVHDVLKESGVVTPRGRKPKDKFKIPLEKKKQIQASLSQVALVGPPPIDLLPASAEPLLVQNNSIAGDLSPQNVVVPGVKGLNSGMTNEYEKSAVYEGAGRVFLKAALWDLGIFSEDNIKEEDWKYYLTYAAGIKIGLENSRSYVIDMLLPLQRSIREVADGVISNVNAFMVGKTSDDALFKASMEAQPEHKITNVAIVDRYGVIICEFNDIVDIKRRFITSNRIFVENHDRDLTERGKALFFSQVIDNSKVMENILNLKGFDSYNKKEYIVNILIGENYANRLMLEQAIERLNGMFLRDEQNRLLSVVLSSDSLKEVAVLPQN